MFAFSTADVGLQFENSGQPLRGSRSLAQHAICRFLYLIGPNASLLCILAFVKVGGRFATYSFSLFNHNKKVIIIKAQYLSIWRNGFK